MNKAIDTTFVFLDDTPQGKDPDSYSPTLRLYHRHLWSRPLPNGFVFELSDKTPGKYLHHSSEVGEFFLSSDAVIPEYGKNPTVARFRELMPKAELDEFHRVSYTIGGMMIFPSNRIEKKNTINGARGFHHQIKDRFDLTVECIRLYYLGVPSPLGDVFSRYADFFALFEDFSGYVKFFQLHDLVTDDFSQVKFMLPFEDFNQSPIPSSMDSYREYLGRATKFLNARNLRISSYASESQ